MQQRSTDRGRIPERRDTVDINEAIEKGIIKRGEKPRLIGLHPGITGKVSDDLRGDISGLIGDVSDLRGTISSGLRGDVTGLRGDITGLSGDVSDLRGDVTDVTGGPEEAAAESGESTPGQEAK